MVSDGGRKSRNPAVQREQDTGTELSSLVLEVAPLLLIINWRRTTEHCYCSPSSL